MAAVKPPLAEGGAYEAPGGHLGDRVPVRPGAAAGPAFDTKQPRADENGEPLYVVQLIALGEGEAEILAVKLARATEGCGTGRH